MKKFMVITNYEGNTHASFFNQKSDADQYKMDAECGIGCAAQVYEWKETSGKYVFLYE